MNHRWATFTCFKTVYFFKTGWCFTFAEEEGEEGENHFKVTGSHWVELKPTTSQSLGECSENTKSLWDSFFFFFFKFWRDCGFVKLKCTVFFLFFFLTCSSHFLFLFFPLARTVTQTCKLKCAQRRRPLLPPSAVSSSSLSIPLFIQCFNRPRPFFYPAIFPAFISLPQVSSPLPSPVPPLSPELLQLNICWYCCWIIDCIQRYWALLLLPGGVQCASVLYWLWLHCGLQERRGFSRRLRVLQLLSVSGRFYLLTFLRRLK